MSKKLNLGCGRNVLSGWINLDSQPHPGVDVVFDLEQCRTTRMPFETNTFDEILASHVIEHIRDPLAVMQELHRIAKPGAIAVVRVPYGSSDDAYEDPTHTRPYFAASFTYFSQPCYWNADYGYKGDWAPQRITLVVDANRYQGATGEQILADVKRFRNVVKEMIAELRAVKPIREQRAELQDPHKIVFKLD